MERLLRAPGVDAAVWNNSCICFASQNGHLAVVERLLQAPGVNAAAQDNHAIRWASASGHLAVVERLLQVPGVKAAAPESICNHGTIEHLNAQVAGLVRELGQEAAC